MNRYIIPIIHSPMNACSYSLLLVEKAEDRTQTSSNLLKNFNSKMSGPSAVFGNAVKVSQLLMSCAVTSRTFCRNVWRTVSWKIWRTVCWKIWRTVCLTVWRATLWRKFWKSDCLMSEQQHMLENMWQAFYSLESK